MKYYLDTEFIEGAQKRKLNIYEIGLMCLVPIISLFELYFAHYYSGSVIMLMGFFYIMMNIVTLKKTKPTIDLISIGIVSEGDDSETTVHTKRPSYTKVNIGRDNERIPAEYKSVTYPKSREYYAISKDFNLYEAWNRWQPRTGQGDRNNIEPREYWIRENVLYPIWIELFLKDEPYMSPSNEQFTYSSMKSLIKKYGKSNKQIAEEIHAFIYKDFLEGTGLRYPEAFNYSNPIYDPEFYAYYADYDWVAFCWLFGHMIDLPEGFPMYCIDLKQTLDEKADFELPNLDKKERVDTLKNHSKYPSQTNEHNALADAKWNKDLHKFLNSL